jgi:hypothetical protein
MKVELYPAKLDERSANQLGRLEGMLLEGLRGLDVGFQAYLELVVGRCRHPEMLRGELEKIKENQAEARLPFQEGLLWVAQMRILSGRATMRICENT